MALLFGAAIFTYKACNLLILTIKLYKVLV